MGCIKDGSSFSLVKIYPENASRCCGNNPLSLLSAPLRLSRSLHGHAVDFWPFFSSQAVSFILRYSFINKET
jgi:hypothetical protein